MYHSEPVEFVRLDVGKPAQGDDVALSNYLTDDEWDACFYASMGRSHAPDFGQSVHLTIESLLAVGYRFQGLDEKGQKKDQVPNNNGRKLLIWLGNPDKVDVVEIYTNGRNFLKKHCPDMVDETDEEFEKAMRKAREQRKE